MKKMFALTLLAGIMAAVGFGQDTPPGTEFHPQRLIVKFRAGSKSLFQVRAANSSISMSHVQRLVPVKPDAGIAPLPGGVVALVQNHGLYTAIPAIPSKPPGIN